MTDSSESAMFRPPVNRAMRVLDRSFFQKSILISAARIRDNKQISKCRAELGHDTLRLDRMQIVRSVRDPEGQESKALLLRPEVKLDDASTWSPRLSELIRTSQVSLLPYDLKLDYDYWNYHDIMSAILPEDEQDEFPSGFSIVGHVAHLNLRDEYLPYKHLIAAVLLDKNPTIRTVINKTDEVGQANSDYRTFSYELLAGDPDLNVEIHEENCRFRFDYSKVYWNSRLNTEHRRLVEMFRPGDAVCDVMAGVGPFAVPAGRKNVFVWANDLNPDSFASLEDAVKMNKVDRFVQTANQDGRTYIRSAAQTLLNTTTQVSLSKKNPSRFKRSPLPPPSPTTTTQTTQTPTAGLLTCPKTFTHYILNLPATALTFLPSFIGLYAGHESLFLPSPASPKPNNTNGNNDNNNSNDNNNNNDVVKLPLIHVYCFSTKSDDNREEGRKICREIGQRLGCREGVMRPGRVEGGQEGEVEVWDVRDVAPLKRMFCASFRLPAEVAFRVIG